MNQMEPNNQVLPTNISTNPGGKKSKWWLIMSVVILFVAITLVVFYLFINKLTKEGENTPSVSTAINSIPPVNDETHQQIVADIVDLMNNIGVNQDAFNLDSTSRIILSNIATSIESSPITIFNTVGYEKIEAYKNGDIYYIKPVGSSIAENEYLEIIKKRTIKPEELLDFDGDQIKKDIHTFFYNDFIGGVSYEKTVTTLKTYLDKQIVSNIISKYEYDDIDGSLLLYYPDKELGEQLNPSLYTKYMDKIISYNANPDKYLNELLKSSQQEFDSGNILIINTKGDAPIFKIINRDVLLNNISILLDDNLNKEEKIKAIAGPVRYGVGLEEKSNETSLLNKLKASFTALAASSGDIDNLLGQSGAIVSPSRAINIFQGVDVPGKNLGNLVIEEFSKTNGVFSSFVKNGYWANVFQHRRTGEPTIEKFAKLFDDANSTNIIYDGHGTPKGKLFMESYYLGKNKEDPDYISNQEKFVKRVDNLQDIYGNDSIAGWENIYSLSDEMLSQMGTWNSDVSLISFDPFKKEDRIFGEIAVTPNFFDAYKSNQKSLVIFIACFSGQLANVINARVLLTAPANSETSKFLFFSDLSKIDLYLLKNQEPGNISFNLDESRTYDILGKFKSDLVISNASSSATIDEKKRCNGKSDTLCTVVFSGSSGQTLAVSPSVKSINGGTKISFNAPLENENVDAKDVVTIDARQCFTSQKILDENKPKWSGDKDITLSWKDKIYRDWQEKDFYENGAPKVNYAIITVKNDKAVSKISEVNLTGNQDACKGERCVSKEAYKDPTEIKLNGNQPNTDFVAIFPCIRIEYYKSCIEGNGEEIIKIIDEDNEYAGFAMPNWIRFSGNCYYHIINPSDQEKEKAVEAKDWSKDESCFGKCGSKEEDCFKHIIEAKEIKNYDKYRTYINSDGITYGSGDTEALFMDDSEIVESCIANYVYNDIIGEVIYSICNEPRSFGDHIAWIKNESKTNIADGESTSIATLMYDNKIYDVGDTIFNLFLYGDNIFYFKSINNEAHIIYNKKDYGSLFDFEEEDWLQLPDFKFSLKYYQINNLDFFYKEDKEDYLKEKGYETDPKVFDKKLIPEREDNYNFLYKQRLEGCNNESRDGLLCKEAIYLLCENVKNDPFVVDNTDKIDYCNGRVYPHKFFGYVNDNVIMGTYLKGEENLFDEFSFTYGESDQKNESAIYNNGEYYPIGNGHAIRVPDVFGKDIAFIVIEEDNSHSLYINNKKQYNTKYINRVQLFDQNYALIDSDHNIVYNGKILGKSDEYEHMNMILYKNYLVYSTDEERDGFGFINGYINLNGKKYNEKSSILTSLYTCKQNYKYNNNLLDYFIDTKASY